MAPPRDHSTPQPPLSLQVVFSQYQTTRSRMESPAAPPGHRSELPTCDPADTKYSLELDPVLRRDRSQRAAPSRPEAESRIRSQFRMPYPCVRRFATRQAFHSTAGSKACLLRNESL